MFSENCALVHFKTAWHCVSCSSIHFLDKKKSVDCKKLKLGKVRIQDPDEKIRTAGVRVINQSHSRIYEYSPLRYLRKK